MKHNSEQMNELKKNTGTVFQNDSNDVRFIVTFVLGPDHHRISLEFTKQKYFSNKRII